MLWAAFVLWPLLTYAAFWAFSWTGAIVASAVIILGGFALWFFLRSHSRSQVAKIGSPMFAVLVEAERLARVGEDAAEVRCRKEVEEANRVYKDEVRTAEKAEQSAGRGTANP